jgi:peptidoglycan-associated lipoprotein
VSRTESCEESQHSKGGFAASFLARWSGASLLDVESCHGIRQSGRMHHLRTLSFLAAALATFGMSACTSTRSGTGGREGDGDYVSGTALGTPLPERQEGVSFLGANVDRSQFAPVYFGFDSSSLPASEKAKLQPIAELCKSSGATILIAGFTDERGTPEYNRGLGERRALIVREELIALGASGSRVQTVSFGEDMPADSGGGESAWAKNRRAEFGVVR